MRQKAKVLRVSGDKATVSVVRQSACGHDCSTCAGCGVSTEAIVAEAINNMNAKAGDTVLVESNTTAVIGIAAVVYFLPVALFFCFYIVSKALGATEAIALICGGFGFGLSVVYELVINRKLKSNSKNTSLRIISIVSGDD